MYLIHLPGLGHSVSWVRLKSTVPGVPCFFWRADLRLCHSWEMSAVQDPRKTRLANGSLLTVWWKMWSLGPRLQQSFAFQLWLSEACISASREGGPYVAAGLLSFDICSILCFVSMPEVTVLH